MAAGAEICTSLCTSCVLYYKVHLLVNVLMICVVVTFTILQSWGALSSEKTTPPFSESVCVCVCVCDTYLHISSSVAYVYMKRLTLRLLMSYIYGAPILDVSRSHTTQHSR